MEPGTRTSFRSDHNHDNNPPDGSNWELLCLYCHDNEHQRYLVANEAGSTPWSREQERPSDRTTIMTIIPRTAATGSCCVSTVMTMSTNGIWWPTRQAAHHGAGNKNVLQIGPQS